MRQQLPVGVVQRGRTDLAIQVPQPIQGKVLVDQAMLDLGELVA
jgi:hypothetical protein